MVEPTVHPILAALIASSPLLLHDTDVIFDSNLVANTESTAYVSVRASSSPKESEPIANASVVLSIAGKEIARARTDENGRAPLQFRVPELQPGAHTLAIETVSKHGRDTIARTVNVVRKLVLSLRTDRKVYRPGETIHFGVALLNRPDAHPIGGAKVAVAVKEPGGTEIWRGQIDVGHTGFGAGKVPLGDDLRLGNYTIEAAVFSEQAIAQVSVREVELPPFFVAIDGDGVLTARYPYGEPVRGRFEIEAGKAIIERGELDELGRHALSARAKANRSIVARVTDGADRTESITWNPPRAAERVSIAIVPETEQLAIGRKQFVTVVTTDGEGHLLPATIELEGEGVEIHGENERASRGAVRWAITPSAGGKLIARATTSQNKKAEAELRLRTERSDYWVRPVGAVYAAGEPIEVFGRFVKAEGPVLLSLIRSGIAVATAIAEPDARGYYSAKIRAPEGVFGLATIRASDIGYGACSFAPEKRITQASIYLVPAELQVTIEGAVRFRPGKTAELVASVKDASGRAAPNVGLFASVVDERALALGERQKDLVELLRGLDVENATALGLTFTELLRREGREAELAARAIVESLPPEQLVPVIEIDALARNRAEQARLPKVRFAAIDALVKAKGAIGRRSEKGWRFARGLADVLRDRGWKDEQILTPWQTPLSWSYARCFDQRFSFRSIARDVAERRMDELATALRGNRARAARVGLLGLVRAGRIAEHLVTDPWGGAIALSMANGGTLRSAGADGAVGTHDDLVRVGVFESVGYGGLGSRGYGHGGGGYASGALGTGRAAVLGAPAAIRSRFDETVLWAAGLVTDADGRAIVRVPFSDSVTGWQLEIDALGPNGAVGHGRKKLETFLPLSVDAPVPSRLTTGDRYTLAAVAANHTSEELELVVSIEASGAIAASGERSERVRLPPGTTKAARFPIVAERSGTGSVLLALAKEDGTIVDRVKRDVRVEGPGGLVQVVLTGQVGKERERLRFDVPVDAESFEGTLRVFRTPLDQALGGIEDMLREPHGCFEQTSSATHPNLMVLQLLAETKENEATRERAYELVAKGYQRLISYEVFSGGFSWFGQRPANQALTAYGLLEFTDMAKVYPVDPELIERTKAWLLSKQGSDGSWAPDPDWLHDWSAVQGQVALTAYITWALVESGERGPAIDRALRFLESHRAELEKKPYLLALWAAASRSPAVLAKLNAHRRKDERGLAFGAGDETLFYAKGEAADVQVTALAAPLLHASRSFADAREAMRWIWSARTPKYGWGSPQGTVLALRAAAAVANGGSDRGAIAVSLDGRSIGALDLTTPAIPQIALPLTGGSHELALAGSPVLADLRLSWRNKTAAPIANGLHVELSVPKEPVPFGRTARVELVIENQSGEVIPMPTAIVPIPPGFAPDKRSLSELVRTRRIDRYEATGAAVHLYLTKLAKAQRIALSYDLIANAECEVTQRAAQVYAYYDPATRGVSGNARLVAR